MRCLLVIFLLVTVFESSIAQQDSTQARLNTIKINLINNVLSSNSVVFSYERVVRPYQSWSAMVGYVEFPKLTNLGSNIHVNKEGYRAGFVAGGEYRFYLKKENKFLAPHGVFIGPYTNFFKFKDDRKLSATSPETGETTDLTLKSNITVLNIGVQLGYQFVLNDRWTFDMVFIGPSASRYGMKFMLEGDYNLNDENIYHDQILEALAKRFPLIKDLVNDQEVSLHGKTTQWGGGFRYQLNVGYHFGRKQKKG